MSRLLIIDDDVQLCKALSLVIQRMGHECDCAHTLAQAFSLLERNVYEVAILDIRLPDGNGLEALPRIRESECYPEVIILSGSSDPDGAELAIRSGAWNYIPKPPTLNKIQLPVQRAIEYYEKKKNTRHPKILKREGIVGESRRLLNCLELMAQASGSDCNVLITGETGTGKELFARAIHANSPRAGKPFIVVDCGALPENLVESILFGHEKGSFTGADRSTMGLLRQAHEGTLFLDEVGELPMSIQKSFLRVLQNRRFRPVGGLNEVYSNFRLVAATNRDLEAMVSTWKFRQDLLFRLRTITISVPPLRERVGDVQILAHHFIHQTTQNRSIARKGFSSEFFDVLQEYSWPGNVRELLHAIEHALAAAGSDTILYPRHLPVEIRAQLARDSLERKTDGPELRHVSKPRPTPAGSGLLADATLLTLPTLKDHRNTAIAQVEREYLELLMHETKWDIPKACDISGLSRQRLYALLKQYAIGREREAPLDAVPHS